MEILVAEPVRASREHPARAVAGRRAPIGPTVEAESDQGITTLEIGSIEVIVTPGSPGPDPIPATRVAAPVATPVPTRKAMGRLAYGFTSGIGLRQS
jgi:hypothetical protein